MTCWLAEFRRSEKKLFGHANASIPHQANNWYRAVLSSANVVKPDTSRSWYDTDCVFMPANINSNHWIMFVILLKQTRLLYMDPPAKPPEPGILIKLCRYLNIQYLLESFSQLQTIWTVENVMETGEFPSQKDYHPAVQWSADMQS
jgi:hypothetical protein